MSKKYGIVTTRKGFDVKKVHDYQKIFDSEFPVFKIIKEDSFVIPPALSVNNPQVIARHNLGFIPAWLIFTTRGISSNHRKIDGSPNIQMSKNELMWIDTNTSLIGHYYIFDFDLEKDFIQSSPKTGEITEQEELKIKKQYYGVAVSQKNKDVKNGNLKEMIFTSGARIPLVHKTKHDSYSGNWQVVEDYHGLGYPPQFLLYVSDLNYEESYQLILSSASDFSLYTDENLIQFSYGYLGTSYSYIILKDPLL